MNTKESTRERISAFADGELDDSLKEIVLSSTSSDEGKADWALYHQIGDILRSEEMAKEFSPGFAARMSARLEAEPTVVSPAAAASLQSQRGIASPLSPSRPRTVAWGSPKRWAIPGTIAAAMAGVAFLATPQIMIAVRGDSGISPPATTVVSHQPAQNAGVVMPVGAPPMAVAPVPAAPGGRDPRVDDYLRAHQRFSPSLYNTAQYARSAAFANDSSK